MVTIHCCIALLLYCCSAMMLMVKYTRPYWSGLTWKQKAKLTWAYGYWLQMILSVTASLLGLLDICFAPSVEAYFAFGE
jgi:hypothetical protein